MHSTRLGIQDGLMDGLFRNKEIRNQLVASFGVVFVLTVLAAVISGIWAALLVLLCGCAVLGLNILYLIKRYRKLSEVSESIDRILHGQEKLLIAGSDEGELAILGSEVRKMTAALKEKTDQLQSEKIMLSDAIADMFHQMRTPITSMSIQLSLLSAEDLSTQKRLELVRDQKKQLERLHWLTETLLKMSKLDAGTVEFRIDRVSVRELADKACAPFIIPLELKCVDLVINAGDECFNGDLSWTAEAIGNLVKNCMEHTPEGGRIKIDALETALYTQIEVTDSGEGFDPVDIPHLFERFYRGSYSSEGSIGIGLALSRAIITRQNGTITAQNSPDGGAQFTIKFYKSVI